MSLDHKSGMKASTLGSSGSLSDGLNDDLLFNRRDNGNDDDDDDDNDIRNTNNNVVDPDGQTSADVVIQTTAGEDSRQRRSRTVSVRSVALREFSNPSARSMRIPSRNPSRDARHSFDTPTEANHVGQRHKQTTRATPNSTHGLMFDLNKKNYELFFLFSILAHTVFALTSSSYVYHCGKEVASYNGTLNYSDIITSIKSANASLHYNGFSAESCVVMSGVSWLATGLLATVASAAILIVNVKCMPRDKRGCFFLNPVVMVLLYFLDAFSVHWSILFNPNDNSLAFTVVPLPSMPSGLLYGTGAYVTFVKMMYISLNTKYVSAVARVFVLLAMFGFDVFWCILNNPDPATFMWFMVVDFVVFWYGAWLELLHSGLLVQLLQHRVKAQRLLDLQTGYRSEDIKLVLENFDNHDAHWKLNPRFFQLGSKVAAGGSGIVYDGEYMGSRCACKVFMASLVDGDLQVIADEVATLWNMRKHPSLVTFYGICHVDANGMGRQLGLVFEWCDNTLSQVISTMDHPSAWTMLLQVSNGMSVLHDQGIVHLDLKPANILFAKDGHARIADFGICRIFDQDHNRLMHRVGGPALPDDEVHLPNLQRHGTLGFYDPGLNGDDFESLCLNDIFAFGVIALACFAREEPYEQLFARDSKAHVMLKNKESLLNVLRDFAESKLGHICTTAAKDFVFGILEYQSPTFIQVRQKVLTAMQHQ